MKLKDLTDRVKRATFEEAPQVQAEQAQAPEPPPVAIRGIRQIEQPGYAMSIEGLQKNDAYYLGLVQATRTEDAPHLNAVLTLVKPLELVIPDSVMRTRAALAQAAATSGTPVDAVRADINELKRKLQREKERFLEMSAQYKKDSIDGVEAKVAGVAATLDKLRAELSDSRGRLEKKRAQFENAYVMRQAELDSLEKQFQ